MIEAINPKAVSLLRYSTPLVEWKRDELKERDRMTRKMMARALHRIESLLESQRGDSV